LSALDPQHVQLANYIAEGDIGVEQWLAPYSVTVDL
jgi:hypothetical protein